MRNSLRRTSLSLALLIIIRRLATPASCLSTDIRLDKFRVLSNGEGTRKTRDLLFTSQFNGVVARREQEKTTIKDAKAQIIKQICPEFIPKFSDALCSRRSLLMAAVVATASIITNEASANVNIIESSRYEVDSKPESVDEVPSFTIPLHYEPSLSAYTISYTVGKTKFGAIIDTGSPFLLVPQTSCRPDYRWGCYRPEESHPALGLKPTRERFDGNEGWVEWREGPFSFVLDENFPATTISANSISNASPAASTLGLLFPKSSSMTFGVISETLMDGPGGIFLGLVKDTDSWIRPSFLGQSEVTSFSVDLRQREGVPKSLTLYGKAIDSAGETKTMSEGHSRVLRDDVRTFSKDAIPLVRDLNKKYGDPTIHYVAVASSIHVNGSTLASTSRKDGKLYVIFDTGCSGMCICPDLFDKQYSSARAQKAKNVWNEVVLKFKTFAGEEVTLSAKRPITTPLASERPWGRKLDGHLVVLGLAFLDGLRMTIDANDAKIWFDQ